MSTEIKVSAKSNPNSVAGMISAEVRQYRTAEVISIGAGSLNQAAKAIAIARGFVAPQGIDLICIPAFCKVMVEVDDHEEERTAMKFIVEPR